MQSAALAEARKAGKEVFPILQVSWVTKGYSLGDKIYAPEGRLTNVGSVDGITQLGGWESIEYGSGIKQGDVQTVETSVSVSDIDQSLFRMLDTYDPRGSACSIYFGAEGLVKEDWEPVFVGMAIDWDAEGLFTRIYMKTDDTALRKAIPTPVFNLSEWSSSYDKTISGTHMPLVMGIHDSYQITARGMVPAINIRYDKDIGYWWLASVGHLVDVRRIYYDGEPVTGGGWSVKRDVFGGVRLTIIEINEGYQPEEGVVVAFDCEGPDENGLQVGTSITNPIRIARAVLEEYAYRESPLGEWRGDHSVIDDTSWDAVEAYFEARGYDAGKRFGGDQNEESAAEILQSLLKAHLWLRIWWTPLGKLAIGIIDHDDVDPNADAWLKIADHHKGGQLPFAIGDRREVYTHLKQPCIWSSSEQKFMSSYEAHDVAAADEEVPLEIKNDWTHTRFTLE